MKNNNTKRKRKSLEDLTLMDRFLFDLVMSDPQNMQDALSLIFNTRDDSRSVRLNLLAFDENNDIIFIAPFDLFGLNKYMYTFRMRCDENTSTTLDDGAVRIYLNTRGTNDDEVSEGLLLRMSLTKIQS